MAKGIYIGNSGIARKVKKMYIGVNGVARKVKKAYIGVNGIAKQFYSGGLTTFNSCPYPTNFDASTTTASGTNDYGRWEIYADTQFGQVREAFDDDPSTFIRIEPISSNGIDRRATIDFPKSVFIKPTNIKVMMAYTRMVQIYGITEDDKKVYLSENVYSTNVGADPVTQNISYSGDYFFKQLTLTYRRYSPGYNRPWVYEFIATDGVIKDNR